MDRFKELELFQKVVGNKTILDRSIKNNKNDNSKQTGLYNQGIVKARVKEAIKC